MANKKKVALACSECGSRNYTITENPNRTERLEVQKFCKYCGKHTLHRETKYLLRSDLIEVSKECY